MRGKSFVFFRNPRPDAFDPETGERYDDVIVFWVASDADKQALVEDPTTPFFTTPHFNGHPSVLLRGCRIGELARDELAEVVYDAWLARAPKRMAAAWLAERGTGLNLTSGWPPIRVPSMAEARDGSTDRPRGPSARCPRRDAARAEPRRPVVEGPAALPRR